MAIHLSVHVLDRVVADLLPHYGADCAVAVIHRASWPNQRVVLARLGSILAQASGIDRTALILVGPAIGATEFDDSALYSTFYDRRFRPGSVRFPE